MFQRRCKKGFYAVLCVVGVGLRAVLFGDDGDASARREDKMSVAFSMLRFGKAAMSAPWSVPCLMFVLVAAAQADEKPPPRDSGQESPATAFIVSFSSRDSI